ncbi:MAG: phenylalanine--tRNA ligase subunit beta [Chitinivibrionales bacterium]|nr:phenylalanine--tRNA ligase subunit beta [Chitinivibrionales bacterium]MBD3394319.1 phenylalanine--tRNA ligase subunit beta [Chitinivibrionales bacterium]
MKLLYNWLKELVAITVSPEQLARDLASIGLEVEAIERRRIPDGVVVGEVTAVGPHPNADRLKICLIDSGGPQPAKVVCGAPNVRPGIKVAMASPGCVLGPNMVVEKVRIRGVESAGMLCSERELSLSDDHSGIMELPADSANGRPVCEVIPEDAVLDIELTPNRGDCLSVLGIAREVAAKYGAPLKSPALAPEESGEDITAYISVSIENADACPRYMGRLVRGVTIAESPDWLKQRLLACGLRPINNVVDVTNYILLLFGQPMHAFDHATIAGRQIIVRNAAEKQTFVTLDDVERTLSSQDLLVCDAQNAIALAGVMGGANTEIAEGTTDVFLECAFFDPVSVRKTAKRLDMSTDSSYRFERGVDPGDGLVAAIDTAAELMRRLAGGTVAKGTIDACPKPIEKRSIALRPSRVQRLLGITISKDEIAAALTGLGMRIVDENDGALAAEVPLFRHDLLLEADLVEEVGRLYGYDNIPAAETATVPLVRPANPARHVFDTVRKALAYAGLHEAVTGSMTSEKRRALLTPAVEPVRILNPLNPDMAQMRTTLLGNLLETVAYNINRKNTGNRFFEIGRTFTSRGVNELPEERDVVAIVLEGDYEAATWQRKARKADFFVLKAVLESLAVQCGVRQTSYKAAKSDDTRFAPESALVTWNNGAAGICGRIREEICGVFDIETPVYYAEMDITPVLSRKKDILRYVPVSRHPAVERDFSFVMPENLVSSVIMNEIAGVSDLVESVEPFDVYRGDKLGEELKSVTFSVRLRAPDRTLTDTEADDVCARIVETVKDRHGVVLRS